MTRSTLFLILVHFCFLSSVAQNYTWMKGNTSGGLTGTYGTLGVPATANNPGGRHGCGTWVDQQGNLWLFGGEGYSSVTGLCWMNDLWKYNIVTNEWTWIRGSNLANATGVYGTMGVPAASNEPGAREFVSTWTDASGNFWMYGGDGFAASSSFGSLGDLWKYNPITNQWTWMKGFNTVIQQGVYGTLNVSAPTNLPGSRYGAAAWKDNGGNLYLFGGRGIASSPGQGHLNDLWRYNITNNEWTWINGTNLTFQNGVYGTLGTPAAANTPGGRYHPSSTQDASGNFYLFGGLGLPASPGSPGYLNDTWHYNVSTNIWTWISGASTTNQPGTYGFITVPSPGNVPGARYSAATWTDPSGKLWMFGGHGFDNNNQSLIGDLSDLWKFDPATAQWGWMKGPNTFNNNGVYGTMGVATPANNPGGRQYNTRWTDNSGNFWLFGGEGYDASSTSTDHMDDLWGFSVPCNPDSLVTVPGHTLCSGNSVTITAYNTNSASVIWYSGPNSTLSLASGSVYSSPPLTAVNGASVYNYYAESNGCGFKPKALSSITVMPLPQLSITGPTQACVGSTFTLTASGASTYTWNSGPSAPTATFSSPNSGTFTAFVLGTSTAGCEGSASQTLLVNVLPTLTLTSQKYMYCYYSVATISVTGASTYSMNGSSIPNTFTVGSFSPTTKTVTVFGTDNNGCVGSGSVTVQFFWCEGVNDYLNDVGLTLYPNPSKNSFTIQKTWNGDATVLVIDLLGRAVLSGSLKEQTTVIEHELPEGAYIITVEGSEKFFRKKIVVSH